MAENFNIGGITGTDGDQLPGTPKHSLTWIGDYTIPVGDDNLVFHINGSYLSSTSSLITPTFALGEEGYSIWDTNIVYDHGNWSVGLFVDNLFNKRHESARRGFSFNSFNNPGFSDPANTNYSGTIYDGLSYNDVRATFASQQDSPGKQLQRSVNRPRTVGVNFSYNF